MLKRVAKIKKTRKNVEFTDNNDLDYSLNRIFT